MDDFYNDEIIDIEKESNSTSNNIEEKDTGNIIPQHLFYEFEEVRKEELNELLLSNNNDFMKKEIDDKIRCTFIHDKVIFDAFNNAMNYYGKRKESKRPWIKQTKAAYDRDYSLDDI
mmetsp:Transcript_6056/g.5211  ORF Transcript_6056/g.5211 Transcript_6056/m.5211 type:complete len:117 (-) Transcript_6056:358-708(-)